LSRDQKPRAKSKSAPKSGGGVLAGIFIGLLLGAIVAAAAAWYFMRVAPVRSPEVAPRTAPPPAPGATAPAPIALPGKPGDRPVEKPQFDFYKILPQGDSAAPGSAKPPANAGTAADAPKAPAPTEKLYLQVGAFQDPAEADNLKARLALLGIEASAQRVEVPDKGTLHRVRVGPYAKPEELDAVRAQLAQAGIPVAVVKNK
jgi:cell division protein FtsN